MCLVWWPHNHRGCIDDLRLVGYFLVALYCDSDSTVFSRKPYCTRCTDHFDFYASMVVINLQRNAETRVR